jgi:catechol 2,3-dioxygenase-like lactoylglutathione lyase family enzyme
MNPSPCPGSVTTFKTRSRHESGHRWSRRADSNISITLRESLARDAGPFRSAASIRGPGGVNGLINHVSVNARDLEESVSFYVDVLSAVPLPSPNFGVPVRWLALGRSQLHLFERDLQPTSHHHFAVTVDDLEPVYRAVERRGAFDRTAFGNHLVELPGDVVQLYFRDPAGNLVEVDQEGVDRLPADLRAQLKGIWKINPQDDENMRGRLFVP